MDSENTLPQSHDLTPTERAIMQNVNQVVLNHKAQIYNLQAELELARNSLSAAEQQWIGAIGMLGNFYGIPNPQISTDFSEITAK